jgi:hypothetical protein
VSPDRLPHWLRPELVAKAALRKLGVRRVPPSRPATVFQILRAEQRRRARGSWVNAWREP